MNVTLHAVIFFLSTKKTTIEGQFSVYSRRLKILSKMLLKRKIYSNIYQSHLSIICFIRAARSSVMNCMINESISSLDRAICFAMSCLNSPFIPRSDPRVPIRRVVGLGEGVESSNCMLLSFVCKYMNSSRKSGHIMYVVKSAKLKLCFDRIWSNINSAILISSG